MLGDDSLPRQLQEWCVCGRRVERELRPLGADGAVRLRCAMAQQAAPSLPWFGRRSSNALPVTDPAVRDGTPNGEGALGDRRPTWGGWFHRLTLRSAMGTAPRETW
jgi:hypothetical protein